MDVRLHVPQTRSTPSWATWRRSPKGRACLSPATPWASSLSPARYSPSRSLAPTRTPLLN